MKLLLYLSLSLLVITYTFAQSTKIPALGAQVIIEPGQKPEDVATWFRLLKENNMSVTRIRVFEEHMNNGTENWDFSLYDRAFDEAQKNGIKVFATLFPAVDPNNIGGFKFPKSENHQDQIAEYIRQVVSHFKDHPALYTWVLINEPGTGKAPLSEPFTRKKYQEWLDNRIEPTYDNGYRKEELLPEMFLRDYNTWYLKWLSDEVNKYDPSHPQHVNPHMIFELLPEYDFQSWHPFLNSIGSSIHPSWHFGYFTRDQYSLAISVNNDIIRAGADPLPFWVTELQGGNNTYSSYYPMNPTKEEIAQWLWTSIGCGAEGIIFWSLNQRTTGGEAGEWGMITNYNEPSDRVIMTKQVGETLNSNRALFESAVPVTSNINIVYVPEAMMVENRYQVKWVAAPKYPGRSEGACTKSALAYYQTLLEMGISVNLIESNDFDWENGEDQIVILANQIALPSKSWKRIDAFVKSGGKLLVSGMTGYYDENVHNVMRTSFPLQETFGAGISEFKLIDEYFQIKLTEPSITLQAHLWRGELKLFGADAIGTKADAVIAIRHSYGNGEVFWLPSLVGLGAWQRNNQPLADLLSNKLDVYIHSVPFHFPKQYPNILMRTLKSGNDYITVLINKGNEKRKIDLIKPKDFSSDIIFSSHKNDELLMLKPEETQVIKWSK